MPRNDRDDYDDDDDDRPRRRRRRDDDDYDHDHPRRRRPAKSGGSSAGLIVLIVVLLGGFVVCGIGGLFFGIQKVRSSAARMSDQNNMRQIGLGMINAEAARGNVSQYARDDLGKVQTGLSFRVEMLRYIEHENVYRLFNVRESWDSTANRTASNTAVKTYRTPLSGPESSPTSTPYRVLYGGSALFDDDGKSVSLFRIPDGSSNTIMLVHATEQVPWAEPRELRYDPKGPLPKFGHPSMSGGFPVILADGSIRVISDKMSETTLRAAITKDGGETLPLDW